MKTFLTTALAAVVAAPAFANDPSLIPTTSTSVPEISALEGTAALAALAAIVLIAWERRRRAA